MTMSLPVSAAALELIPVGSAVGIEVDVDGAMVEELSEVNTSKGSVQPAKKAGIKEGDVITAVNGKEIKSLSDFALCAQAFDGSAVKITVLRQGKTIDCNVTPVLNTEGKYQIGLWLRDKVAGVGTVTYYNPLLPCFLPVFENIYKKPICTADYPLSKQCSHLLWYKEPSP